MVNALSDVEGNILDCKKAIEEFDNELLQLHWDVFDRIQGQFKDLDSELSNLRGLFDDFKVTDGKFNWSKEGLAQLGLLTQQYELAQYQVQQYNTAIDDLNAAYSAGKYSATEYVDKLSELSKGQWDAVNSSESIKDAIIDLNEVRINEDIDAIEKEISAYKELIDAQIDALKAAKDLHDYQQSIAEKTKSVTDLERQIAAMQNDDTAATVAKRKQLEEQLAEARKDLENAQYDHSIDEQENALNKQYEDYKKARDAEIEALKASLDEREGLIAASFETVKANADIVGQEIAYIATQHGITISDAIITSWQNGEQAIASYGEVLAAGTSAFIGNIMGVENEVYALQYKANETANSLAWMFATRADNLVNELAASYYSEENLNYMTKALHDSLINTLEGGYNISSITSALDGIANGLNGVASAANNAASAMAAMGAAQAGAAATGASGNYSNSSASNISNSTDMKIVRQNSGEIREVMQKEADGKWHKYAYAKGTRNAKGGLRVINEEGQELTLSKLQSGNYAIGNEGDQILTKDETDNVYEWAKTNPEEYAEKEAGKEKASKSNVPKGAVDMSEFLKIASKNNEVIAPDDINEFMELLKTDTGRAKLKDPKYHSVFYKPIPVNVQPPSLTRYTKSPEIVSSSVNNNNKVNVHYDSLITVNGDVNDTNHFLNGMKKVANDAIKQSWHDFEMTRKYGIY